MNEGNSLSIRRIYFWLTSREVINLPFVAFVLIWPFATGFLVGETAGQQFAFSIHLFDLLGSSVTAASLFIGDRIFRWKPAALLFAAVFGTVVPIWIIDAFSFVPTAYVDTIPTGILGQITNMVAFVIFWNVRKEAKSSVRELALARKSLSYLNANLKSELVANQQQLRDYVLQVLEPAVDQLSLEMKSGLDNSALAQKLRSSIDQVIRPLSHQLASEENNGGQQTFERLRQFEKEILRLPARERLVQILQLTEIANIPLAILAHVAFIIPASYFLFGPNGTLSSILAGAVVVGINLTIAKLAKNKTFEYWKVLLAAVLLALAVEGVWILVVSARLPGSETGLKLAVGLIVFLANFLAGYVNCQLSIRNLVLGQARKTNEKLQAAVTQLKQDVWLNRRRLARVIHGSVQANLQSAALRLIKGNKNGDVAPGELADEIAGSVKAVFSDHSEQAPLSSAIKSLQEFWNGVCELTVEIDPELLSKVEANPKSAECLYELISEATSNAVKHASAEEVDARISADNGSITVEIRNAHGLSVAPKIGVISGYGSRIYDEITAIWSLTFDESDAILKATLPLG